MASLLSREPRFASAFRDAVIGMMVLDLDGRVLDANEAAARVIGRTREELLATDFRAVTHPDDVPTQFARMRELLAGARPSFQMDKRYLRADGTVVRGRLSMSLLRDAAGAPCGFVSQIEDLTARHEAEEARDAFFDLAPDPLAIVSPDGRFLQVNPAWERLLGWTAEELCARPYLDLVHPDDRERTVAEAVQTHAGRPAAAFRNRYRTRAGDYRWVEWKTRRAHDDRLYCAVRDVTAEEEARQALEDTASRHAAELASTQRRLALHAGNTPLAVIEWDAQGRVTRWSARAVELFGWSEDEVLGRSIDDWRFVHEQDLDAVSRVMRRLAGGRSARNISAGRNYTRSGDVVHCEWFHSALHDEDGRLVSLMSQVQDVTEHELTLRALRHSEERFRATFEQAAVGLAHVGLDGGWLRVNGALCRMLGYTAAELLPLTFQHLTHPEDLDKDLQLLGQLVDGAIDHYSMEKRYFHRHGHVLWTMLTVSLLRDAEGRPLHFVSVVEDIAARKAAELALQRVHGELEQRVLARTADLREANAELSREVRQRAAADAALRDSELRLRSILENSHDAFVAIDEAGAIVEWNGAAEQTFGWQREDVIGRPMGEVIVPPALRGMHDGSLQRYVDGGDARVLRRRVQLPALHRDGHEFPVELTISEVLLRGRRLFTAFLHDISARLAAERKLRENEERLRLITDNVPALIAYVDADLHYRFVNPAYERWFDHPPGWILGRSMCDVVGQARFEHTELHVRRVLAGEQVEFERDSLMADGSVRHGRVTYVPDRRDGQVVGFYSLIQDMTSQHELTRMLRERALRDELTGLPNRAAWNEHLERGLSRAQRLGTAAAVMFLDLDGFKQVNDTHGHDAGDALLREFATRLSANLRRSDTVARLGGDEFVVLLENLKDPSADPAIVAHKVLAAMQPAFVFDGVELRIVASIGIALQRQGRCSAEALMRRADEAMYRAKRAGAGGFELVEL